MPTQTMTAQPTGSGGQDQEVQMFLLNCTSFCSGDLNGRKTFAFRCKEPSSDKPGEEKESVFLVVGTNESCCYSR